MKKKAFSLAEMMVVMVIVSIMLAAAAPIITKKAAAPQAVSSGSGVPIGTIIIWSLTTLPAGQDAGKWLICNGQSTNGYPKLAALVGANVPNYQGYFLRGFGGNSAQMGVEQTDAIRNITGAIIANGVEAWPTLTGAFYKSGTTQENGFGHNSGPVPNINFDASLVVPVANENRPINKSVYYLIKAKD